MNFDDASFKPIIQRRGSERFLREIEHSSGECNWKEFPHARPGCCSVTNFAILHVRQAVRQYYLSWTQMSDESLGSGI
jgi:hypothetical protein